MTLAAEQTWLILVDLLTDLKKREVNIPNSLNKDISLIKTSINFYKRDPTHPDMIKEFERASKVLTEVQDQLLSYGEDLDEDYCNEWIDKLKRANLGEELYKEADSHSRFISNAPPGFSSAKIHLKNPIAEDRVQEIAEYNNMIIEFEDDTTVAIYGDSDNVKVGLKELAPFFNE